jgi:hypothetical protein
MMSVDVVVAVMMVVVALVNDLRQAVDIAVAGPRAEK